jgi:hypothetical protein
MATAKRDRTTKTTIRSKAAALAPSSEALLSSDIWDPAAKIRNQLGVSAVTMWRWRHDARTG